MNLAEIWLHRSKCMFEYIEHGKQALEMLGYTENNTFDDHGGNTVVLWDESKLFNTAGAFFVGVYIHTMKANTSEKVQFSESDLEEVLVMFDSFFWGGYSSSDIKEDIENGHFFNKEYFEDKDLIV